ncbi:hypothetical protein B0H13DRAFT_1881792 [Mycena leptocephala]|nr:hypothetical protein B0H13DRAFT_1881792 [Mycena leptocephala]
MPTLRLIQLAFLSGSPSPSLPALYPTPLRSRTVHGGVRAAQILFIRHQSYMPVCALVLCGRCPISAAGWPDTPMQMMPELSRRSVCLLFWASRVPWSWHKRKSFSPREHRRSKVATTHASELVRCTHHLPCTHPPQLQLATTPPWGSLEMSMRMAVRIEMEMKREIVMDDGDALEKRAMERHSRTGARRRACCDAQAREVDTEAGRTLSSCLPTLASPSPSPSLPPSPVTEESTDPVSTWRGTKRTELKLRWSASPFAHSQRWRSAGAGAGAGDVDIEADVTHHRSIEAGCPRASAPASPSSSYADTEARALRIWIYFWGCMRSRRLRGGDREFASVYAVLVVAVHCSIPFALAYAHSPSLHYTNYSHADRHAALPSPALVNLHGTQNWRSTVQQSVEY